MDAEFKEHVQETCASITVFIKDGSYAEANRIRIESMELPPKSRFASFKTLDDWMLVSRAFYIDNQHNKHCPPAGVPNWPMCHADTYLLRNAIAIKHGIKMPTEEGENIGE